MLLGTSTLLAIPQRIIDKYMHYITHIPLYLQHAPLPAPKTTFHAKLALCAGGLVKSKLQANLVHTPESAKLFEYNTEAVLSSLTTPRIHVCFEMSFCIPSA